MQRVKANLRVTQRREGGFSLIELVAVLVVVAVIAFVALPKSDNDTLVVSTQAEQLAGAIRYAQASSMSKGGLGSSGRRYRIVFTSSSYQFFYYDVASATSTGDLDPYSGLAGAVSLASGVTLTIPGALPSSLVGFNGLGIPYTDAAVTTALAANADIVVTKGSSSRTLRIFPETGMVRLL